LATGLFLLKINTKGIIVLFRFIFSFILVGWLLYHSSCSFPTISRREYIQRKRRRSGSRRERVYQVIYGKASYYGDKFHGRRTANGEVYNQFELTAAHKTFPFNTICRVTNLANGKRVTVRINDRGPFIRGRILDLSYQASKVVDGVRAGVIDVKIEILKWGEDKK
jgi:rare lipoprotein A